MIKKISDFRFSYKAILILVIVVLCLLLIPMLYAANWNVPSSDDYGYTIQVHDTILGGGNLFDVLASAAERTKFTYFNWQGSICAVFLFTLQPSVFGVQYYVLVPYIMLTALITGVCLFFINFFRVFGISKRYSLIISVIVLIACTQFLPHAVESFYWYNGSVYYTFFFGISLVLYVIIIKLIFEFPDDKGTGRIIAAGFLCMFVALGNLVTALTTNILLVSLWGYLFFSGKRKLAKKIVIPVVLFELAFCLNVFAPGNAIRQREYIQRYGAFESILMSFRQGYIQFLEWNFSPVLALYLFLFPLLWKIASGADYSFQRPWLVTLYSYCLISAMNCPTIYATSIPGQGRILNIIFFANVILVVINLFYWFGWISKHCFQYIGNGKLQLSIPYVLFVALVFTLYLFSYPYDQVTSVSAVRSYLNGEMGSYKHVYNQRLKVLNDPEITDPVLRRFPENKPYVLFFDDIITNIEDYRNVCMSQYFHKNSVRLSYPGEEVSVSKQE